MFGFLQVLCRKDQSLLFGLSEDTIHNSEYVRFIICCLVSEFVSVFVCECVAGDGYETCQVRRQYASIRNSLRSYKPNEILL
jgi:hypothetical protein